MLEIIKGVLSTRDEIQECIELNALVELQKNLTSIREIHHNRLIGIYKKDEDNNVVFENPFLSFDNRKKLESRMAEIFPDISKVRFIPHYLIML